MTASWKRHDFMQKVKSLHALFSHILRSKMTLSSSSFSWMQCCNILSKRYDCALRSLTKWKILEFYNQGKKVKNCKVFKSNFNCNGAEKIPAQSIINWWLTAVNYRQKLSSKSRWNFSTIWHIFYINSQKFSYVKS